MVCGVATSPAIVLLLWLCRGANIQTFNWKVAVINVASDFTQLEKEGSVGDSGHHLTAHSTRRPVVPTGMALNSESRSIYRPKHEVPLTPASRRTWDFKRRHSSKPSSKENTGPGSDLGPTENNPRGPQAQTSL